MSMLSKLLGNDRRNLAMKRATRGVDAAIDQERAGTGWEDSFNRTAGAFVQSRMPELEATLQGTRENAIRRGISTGDLGTSYEGDVLTTFQRNIAQTLAGMANQNYNTSRERYLGLLGGKMDAAQSDINSNRNMWAGIGGGVLGGVGSWMGGR